MSNLEKISPATNEQPNLLKHSETIPYLTTLFIGTFIIFACTMLGLLIYSVITDPIARQEFVKTVVTMWFQLLAR